MTTASTLPLSPAVVTAEPSTNGHGPAIPPTATAPSADVRDEAMRLASIERRLLFVIQAIVFGGVILLTVGAGALSWSHLTHIAETNGHIAPRGLLFVFPTIVDGFMVMGSGVVVRHALTDELGGRTWYAGTLVAASAALRHLPEHPGLDGPGDHPGLGPARHSPGAVHARHRAGPGGAAAAHAQAAVTYPGRHTRSDRPA